MEDNLKMTELRNQNIISPVDSNGNVATTLYNEEGTQIDVQHPLPTDGDSVYNKDIDTTNSDNGNFSGEITDYFDSLKTVNSDATANNPKTIKVWFKRTVYASAIGLGCDNLAKNFGNSITLELLGSGEVIRCTVNSTGDINSRLIEFEPSAFNGFNLKFNTASEVCLSNITIQKEVSTQSTIKGQTPDGTTENVQVTEDGNLTVSDNSSGLAIAKGDVTGHSAVQKFGNAPDFDSADGSVTIWDGADDGTAWELMNYQYSTTADIDSISSSNAGDTQEMVVQGLDTNWELVNQSVTLNGQNRVALTTPLVRVFRVYNNNSIDLNGNVIVYVNTALTGGVPTDKTKIRAVVDPTNQQTEMAVYTVPAGKTGYLTRGYASTSGASKTTNYVIRFYAREFGKVFRLQNVNALTENGSSIIVLDYFVPLKIPEKTDLEVRVEATGTGVTAAAVSAGFDLVLVDN